MHGDLPAEIDGESHLSHSEPNTYLPYYMDHLLAGINISPGFLFIYFGPDAFGIGKWVPPALTSESSIA